MTGFVRRLLDRRRCRYSDCIEAHPVAHNHERVTCPCCRDYLGLGAS